nr:unnamed protein product [Digitaria exilis]
MKKSSLLSLLLVLLAVSSLPRTAVAMVRLTVMATAGTSPNVECVGDGIYTANSTYEANRRRLAAVLLAEARDHPYYTERAVGHWPNRLEASFFCRRRDVDDGHPAGSGDSSCAACIADAFLEVDRECPYHREASFSSRNCTLELEEYRILGTGGIHGMAHPEKRPYHVRH